VNWNLLRVRLENLCPSKQSISTLSSLNLAAYAGSDNRENGLGSSRDHLSHTGGGGGSQGHVNEPRPGTMYILQVEVEDRVGLLHDVTQELWASELTVRRAHISTSPADTAVDLFYVTDERDELPAEARVAEISRAVQRVSGRRGGGDGAGRADAGAGVCLGAALGRGAPLRAGLHRAHRDGERHAVHGGDRDRR
jgi:hypothetical protein